MNFYINKYQLLLTEAKGDKIKTHKVLDRIASNIASLMLGLYPNETIKQYYTRMPQVEVFMEWWQQKRKFYNY